MQKVVLFGVGLRYRQYREDLHEEFNVIALMDNDSEKIGTTVDGITVISPAQISDNDYNSIVITTSAPKCNQMIDQLVTMGVPSDSILLYRNKKVNSVSNGRFEIVCIGTDAAPYFVLTDGKVNDGITYEFRVGNSCVDKKLAAIFSSPGFFLDLGANIGAFSLYYASKGWSGFAYEASLTHSKLLEKSIIVNDFDVKVHNVAVSDFTGKLSFRADREIEHIVSDISDDSSDKIIKIPCVAFDDIMDETNRLVPTRIDFKHQFDTPQDAAGHIKSSLFGVSLSFIISEGKLMVGHSQGVFFMEFDGPRKREYFIKILADA